MKREIEIARSIITTYLTSLDESEPMIEAMSICTGNNILLLQHINALINIFNRAKTELEIMLNDYDEWLCIN